MRGGVHRLLTLESLWDHSLHWRSLGPFLSHRAVDIRIVLQPQKFPNKAQNHWRVKVLCNSAPQQRKESKYLLLSYFRQLR